jgi:hypothetical protein
METNLAQVLKDVDGNVLNAKETVALVDSKTKQFLLDGNGNKLTTTIESKDEPTLKVMLVDILLSEINHVNPQEPLESEEKSKRYALFFKINTSKGDKVSLTPKEVSHLDELLWAMKPTMIAGQCADMINGK